LKLEILTPDKTLYSGDIKSVNLPGSKGRFTLLHNHAPIVSTLEKGQVTITTNDQKTEVIDIIGGIVEVKKNSIIVLADLI
jgi:F-type H+-transporting ATPase subunit epsilon